MIARYRISKITGPSGVFAGYILLVFGLVALYFSLTAIPVIILGAILAFSTQGSVIDFGSKRYKPLFYLFGFLPFGSWVDLEPDDTVYTKHMKGRYITLSRSNRKSAREVEDYRVILQRDADRKKLTLARFQSESEASDLVNKIQTVLNAD